MSVINKMLRDLDARRAGAAGAQTKAVPDLLRGTVRVSGVGGRASPRRWMGWALGSMMVAAAVAWGVVGWLDEQRRGTEGVAAPVSAPGAVAMPPAARPDGARAAGLQGTGAPVPAASALPPVSEIMDAAAAAAAQRAQTVDRHRSERPHKAADGGPVQSAGSVAATAQPATQSIPVSPMSGKTLNRAAGGPRHDHGSSEGAGVAQRSDAPVQQPMQRVPDRGSQTAGAAAPALPASAATLPAGAMQRRAQAVQETLGQALALWGAGSREPAVDLLREALASAERAHASDAEIEALARELARMELAQGRASAALQLLTRLQPRLQGQADLWALRGNAAQRLGHHEDAVLAYEQALRLRAGEPRWLLAAAVSLTALGQLEAAAQYVAQARSAGPVNPEVLNYLRQAGVAVPADTGR